MRIVLLLLLLVLLSQPSLAAEFPCPFCNTSTPACISLVGSTGGVPATSAGQFQVIVRDLANTPVVGANVAVDFSLCDDLEICADQLDAGVVVNCAAKMVTRLTDANGSAVFTILGGSNGSGNASTLLGGGRIFANGVQIQSPTVSAYDLDGAAGVGANDLSAWLKDFGLAQPFGRDDYDCSGTVGANDLSLWLKAFGSGTMTSSCGASCH